MTILILHGVKGYAGINWQKWLHDKLLEKGHRVLMPDLPEADNPNRSVWLNTVKSLVNDVKPEELVIVGHSLGVATALDYLEQINTQIKALISIAGFSKDYGSELNTNFMKEKSIDMNEVLKHLQKRFVLFGDNDPYVPQNVLLELAQELNVNPVIINKGGHLNAETGYMTFPLLLQIIDSI